MSGMILSHKHKFIFIKGKKVAGTSIEIALSSICGCEDIITPITPIDELLRINTGRPCQNFGVEDEDVRHYLNQLPHGFATSSIPIGLYFNHMSLEKVISLTNDSYKDYIYVVAERNPYSKVLSGAVFNSFFDQYKAKGTMKAEEGDYAAAIDEYFDKNLFLNPYNFDTYSMHIRNPDFVIRYESLYDDFNLLLKSLGINFAIDIPHTKKGGSFSPENVYDYLNKRRIDMINESYKKEFEYFRYSYL